MSVHEHSHLFLLLLLLFVSLVGFFLIFFYCNYWTKVFEPPVIVPTRILTTYLLPVLSVCLSVCLLLCSYHSPSKFVLPVSAHGAPKHFFHTSANLAKEDDVKYMTRKNNVVEEYHQNCRYWRRQDCNLLWIWLVLSGVEPRRRRTRFHFFNTR